MIEKLIIYDSRGGTTRGVANQVSKELDVRSVDCVDILEGRYELPENRKYVFITYTDKIGELPIKTQEFLKGHSEGLKAVVGNGSSDFKKMGMFGKAGEIISNMFNVPLLYKLDRGGSTQDIVKISNKVSGVLELGKNVELKEKKSYQLGTMMTLTRA